MNRRIWRRYIPSKWKSQDGTHIRLTKQDSADTLTANVTRSKAVEVFKRSKQR